MDYKDSGVDIDRVGKALDDVEPLIRGTYTDRVVDLPWGFAGLFALSREGEAPRYKDPVLVGCTDGVGTKLKVAMAVGRHDTVGIDLVAMNVNDLVVTGAEPLFFLDYVATGALDPRQFKELLRGIAAGCREAGCALIGGETAQMPGFYAPGEYDIAGFAVGVVERADVLRGDRARPGDLVLGLASTGLHSNGFSLVRRVLIDKAGYGPADHVSPLDRPLGDVLLTPTRIYVRPVRSLLASPLKPAIRGFAHITGGGIVENLPRALPEGTRAVIRRAAYDPVPAVFRLIAREGEVNEEEMFRVFNMGIGMAIVVAPEAADAAIAHLNALGAEARAIGVVEAGERAVIFKS